METLLDLYNKEKEKNEKLKDKIKQIPKTEYCNAECLMNGIYVDWDDIQELLEEGE